CRANFGSCRNNRRIPVSPHEGRKKGRPSIDRTACATPDNGWTTVGASPPIEGLRLKQVPQMPSTYFCEVCLSSTIRIQTTRGLLILVARLTAREHKRIFSLCHYFAIMKPVAENESRHLGQNEMARIERQKRPSR